jgi:hypothetical protein
LVTKRENGTARTRHLQAKQAILYEEIVEKESVMIMYTRTTQMIADVLTKPLGGELFYKLANVLMGWSRVLTDFAETTGCVGIIVSSRPPVTPTVPQQRLEQAGNSGYRQNRWMESRTAVPLKNSIEKTFVTK